MPTRPSPFLPSHMENGEKSRKRRREDEDDHPKGRSEAPDAPSLGEVEEFFEILRRVHVAVRYFDKRVNVGDGGQGRGFSWRTREALETGLMEPTAASSEAMAGEEPAKDKVLFDLNGEPDPEMAETEVKAGGQTAGGGD
ncbi:hypothetical protein MLD38_021782 [Melastoma candidum]|uniref:Uncharacterized protein n=1 Tax=Melastoma candidum TaxID=119954 RepID=A0ACB9QH40_9MYRT|nr:hypothetical protein MLD38_021782 [Melastoma candidum]